MKSQIAIVVHNHDIRGRLAQLFDPSAYRIIVPGQALNGFRFRGVVMTSGALDRMRMYASPAATERMDRWYNNELAASLLPGAKVVHI
jgi:hypothetical protein